MKFEYWEAKVAQLQRDLLNVRKERNQLLATLRKQEREGLSLWRRSTDRRSDGAARGRARARGDGDGGGGGSGSDSESGGGGGGGGGAGGGRKEPRERPYGRKGGSPLADINRDRGRSHSGGDAGRRAGRQAAERGTRGEGGKRRLKENDRARRGGGRSDEDDGGQSEGGTSVRSVKQTLDGLAALSVAILDDDDDIFSD